MKLTREEWSRKAALVVSISSDFTFQFSKCATEKQVNWRQKQVNRPIPQGIRDFACGIGSRLELRWDLKPEVITQPSFEDDFPSSGWFEFNFYETDLNKLDGWEHSFTHWQDYRSAPNPYDFKEIFPVFGLMNGDLIVELIGERDRGMIYYLDHESGSGDWKRLAGSYEEFLSTLSDLWFPDLEWHGSLDKFYDPVADKLSAELPFAVKWRRFMSEATLSSR